MILARRDLDNTIVFPRNDTIVFPRNAQEKKECWIRHPYLGDLVSLEKFEFQKSLYLRSCTANRPHEKYTVCSLGFGVIDTNFLQSRREVIGRYKQNLSFAALLRSIIGTIIFTFKMKKYKNQERKTLYELQFVLIRG